MSWWPGISDRRQGAILLRVAAACACAAPDLPPSRPAVTRCMISHCYMRPCSICFCRAWCYMQHNSLLLHSSMAQPSLLSQHLEFCIIASSCHHFAALSKHIQGTTVANLGVITRSSSTYLLLLFLSSYEIFIKMDGTGNCFQCLPHCTSLSIQVSLTASYRWTSEILLCLGLWQDATMVVLAKLKVLQSL